MIVIKKKIISKLTDLKKIKGLENPNDNWELQKLIVTYNLVLSFIDSDTNIDIKKLTTYLEPLENSFEYFINHNSQKIY